MKITLQILILTLSALGINDCQHDEPSSQLKSTDKPYDDIEFSDYWYAGLAEVSSYTLSQSRYGELHKGEAVLIFVTEPFSPSEQVKADNPGENDITVMKNNFTKKFNTGIYPYSMMLSTFTPIDRYKHPKTLKSTMSGQEWCGHVFAQLNLKDAKYKVKSFSYFQSEGDKEFEVNAIFLEDEVWNQIRLNYKALPTGNIKIIPGLFYTRLKHKDLKPKDALASLKTEGDNLIYTLEFNDRKLAITFQKQFPFKILSWTETYPGIGGKNLTTTATLDKTLKIDYWSRNNNADLYLRDSLQLEY